MSTVKVLNIQNPSASNPCIITDANGAAAATLSRVNGGQLTGFRNKNYYNN